VRALVLSAGFGTRLGHLTEERPKPMLDVAGRPILEWILLHLASQGVSEVALNLHFMPDAIRGHFGSGDHLGASITYSYEEELLGTAGAARELTAFLSAEDEFLLHYGDVVTDQELGPMLAFHRSHPGPMTILVHERERSNSVVVAAPDGRVERFLERPSPEQRHGVDSRLVFSGVCICDGAALDSFPAGRPADLPRDVFPALVERGGLYAFELTGRRVAVDSQERLDELRAAVASGGLRIA
jgi:NDP-sugar pyrophosphorylase family protein